MGFMTFIIGVIAVFCLTMSINNHTTRIQKLEERMRKRKDHK